MGGWEAFIGSLTSVTLTNIIIKEIYPCTFKGFTSATVLWMRNTSTTVIHKGAFEGLMSLEHLTLKFLPLQTFPFTLISPVINTLERIDLEGTDLTCECENFWLKINHITFKIVWNESPELGCRDEENEVISMYEYGMQYCTSEQMIGGTHVPDDVSCSENSTGNESGIIKVEENHTEIISEDGNQTRTQKSNSSPVTKYQVSLLIGAIFLAHLL